MTDPVDRGRRAVVGVGVVGLLDPAEAAAGIFPHEATQWRREDATLAARLRRRRENLRPDMAASLLSLPPDGANVQPSSQVNAAAAEMREGLIAMELFKEFEHLPVEAQAQTEVQQFFRGVIASIGRAVSTAADWLRQWADGPGLKEDPHETHLRGALRVVRMSLAGGPLSADQVRRAEAVYADLADGPEHGALRPRVRRALRRVEKARRLAAEVATHRASTGLFEPSDPSIRVRVLAALGPQAVEDQDPWETDSAESEDAERSRGAVSFGAIVTGVLVTAGVLILLALVCEIACTEGVVGALVLLAGAALILLLARRATGEGEEGEGDGEDGEAGEGGEVGEGGLGESEGGSAGAVSGGDGHAVGLPIDPEAKPIWVDVQPADGWVDAGITLVAGEHWGIQCVGSVWGGSLWACGGDGDGVLAGNGAPLPGAPARSLVGRVLDTVFFIGAESILPGRRLVLPEGRLQLAINVSPEGAARLRGGFTVGARPVVGPGRRE